MALSGISLPRSNLVALGREADTMRWSGLDFVWANSGEGTHIVEPTDFLRLSRFYAGKRDPSQNVLEDAKAICEKHARRLSRA
jgi:hypothetical protein